jgi:hypothetical protein
MEESDARGELQKDFWIVLAVATAFRMLLAAVVPLSGGRGVLLGLLASPGLELLRPASAGDLGHEAVSPAAR